MQADIQSIHDFWFGPLDTEGFASSDRHSLWFTRSEETDHTCRAQFGPLVEDAMNGRLEHWADSDEGLVALVLLLDQFTRNIFRDTAQAFSGDPLALAISKDCIAADRQAELPAIHQVFLFMPFEHSEDAAVQARCVELFSGLAERTGHEQIRRFLGYAEAHREVINRFGRFPHRNALLGRESTPDELAFMASHGGF